MGRATLIDTLIMCLATLPQIDAAFSTGVISYSKVRAMTRAATPENEAHLLQVARHGTAQHVEKLVRKFTRASRLNEPQQDKCQYEAREFSWYHDDDGMLVFKGRLPAAEGAAFLKAMEAISPLVPTLCVGMHTGNASSSLPMHSHAERGNEVVWLNSLPFMSADVSAETFHPSRCSLESDGCHFPLAATTARRLACDAALVTVQEDATGNVLNVGRKTRTIPPAIRRALVLRDQGCRFPGCCETRFVDAHHIHHWCEGGETRLDNLILLYRHHHTLLHPRCGRESRWTMGLRSGPCWISLLRRHSGWRERFAHGFC